MSIICQICQKEFKKLRNLQYHVSVVHQNEITSEEYHSQFILEVEYCPFCDKKRKFIGFSNNRLVTCGSKICSLKERERVWFEKYGVKHPMQNKEIREKYEKTLFKRYNVKNPNQIISSLQKSKETCLKKYGVEYAAQSKEVQEKAKQTCLEKYQVENPRQSLASRETHFKKFLPYIYKLADIKGYQILSKYKNHVLDLVLNHKKCKQNFITTWQKFQQGKECPICFPIRKGISKEEKQVKQFVESLGFEIIENDRKLIYPLELDIVIPEKKLAIEYTGFYYHSSGGLGIKYPVKKNYHLNKLELCSKIGYTLITIFADEWLLNETIVKNRLKHALNIFDGVKLRASLCKIKLINSKEKNNFLKQYHIQGKDNSVIKLGAFYKNKLISVMTFNKGTLAKGHKNKREGVWELNRFCSHYNFHIYGIASKFLKYFKKNYEWKEIFSYADRRWSNGNLYTKIGFEKVSQTNPNYWYWGNEIIGKAHRFIFRKSRLKSLKNYNELFTEQQIMILEGYAYIYDCGSLKFRVKNHQIEESSM